MTRTIVRVLVAVPADGTVPIDLSRRVAADAETELLVLAGVDHNDRQLLDGERYLDESDASGRRAVDQG